MAFVITQRCCNDASCVVECPVDCIRPRPDEPAFATAEILHIDPDTCIDCGACVEACPVDAIFGADELPPALARYADINAAYFERNPLDTAIAAAPNPIRVPRESATLRVAVVGTGPAACYAAEQLLGRGRVEIDMFDRLPAPWGLARYGVAPDHPETRGVTDMFNAAFKRDAVRMHLNVDIGRDVTHDELLAHFHAVIYAVGAAGDRRLGIPGEDLAGSYSATEFVAWYNGHPDFADRRFDLSGERAVIVGNGNVALDIARVLTADPATLGRTDIADHALEALRHSNIREVVLLGRRGLPHAAFTGPEFLALAELDVDVVIDPADIDDDVAAVLADPSTDPALRLKLTLAGEYARQTGAGDRKRIVFRFLVSPAEVSGADSVAAVRIVHNELRASADGATAVATDRTEVVPTSLILRAVGYRGNPIPDVPFDSAAGVIPHRRGRVVDAADSVVPGVYTAGWIKRGARGVIGTNRGDAEETVTGLIEDFLAGSLAEPDRDRAAFEELLTQRCPQRIDRGGWMAVDAAERAKGALAGRPRVKFVRAGEIVDLARRGM
ncbi:FAD-dependent oxidoreductase [Nocardia sp. NPDC050718]|uniref:FAD-dependent oxidoreductase n=1 Tax=Nocardia sp. NPDC050718 TaxID=3155788 RepID=UPI003401FF36